MAEYIERNTAKRFLGFGVGTIVSAAEALDQVPAADVAPVVHGWWESVDSSYWRWKPSGAVSVLHITYRCGRCGRGTVVKTNYCPNCGAKMDGGAK